MPAARPWRDAAVVHVDRASSEPVASAGGSGQAGTLVVRLVIEDAEPLAGSVRTEDGAHELAFSGWLGLVETLSLLRLRARDAL
jgi:hypothetical protein